MDNNVSNTIGSINNTISSISSVMRDADSMLNNFNKLAFEQIPNLGSKFISTVKALKEVAVKLKKPIFDAAKTINKIEISGDVKETAKNVVEQGKKFGGFLKKNADKAPKAASAINPGVLLMIVAMASINKKLDNLQETQREIYDFLKLKEQSELRGNVEFLHKSFDEYRFNWDNERFKDSKCNAVQEIKRRAEGNIAKFREEIIREISKKVNALHSEKEVKNKIEEIAKHFKNYELAVYMCAFASFMEVMLIENFKQEYLDEVANEVESRVNKYRELHKECYDKIEMASQSSLQSKWSQGVANISKALGTGIAKIPKISDGQLDENLIAKSEKTEEKNLQRTEKVMELFGDGKCDCVNAFVANIRTMNKIFNEGMEILFDSENIYYQI